jgi:hypothetical protein
MANTRPKPVGFLGAARLCILLLLAPRKFAQEEAANNQTLNASTTSDPPTPRALVVRRAFLYSLLLVIAFGVVGLALGVLFGNLAGCATSKLVAWLQIIGASLLLWGTLFVRGWEIQTYGNVTFTERVNQWLYRALYCLGTAVLVLSVSWPQCTAT